MSRIGLVFCISWVALGLLCFGAENPGFSVRQNSFENTPEKWLEISKPTPDGSVSLRALGWGEDTCGDWKAPAGFSFPYGGENFTTFRICTNGALGFVGPADPLPDNESCGEGVICWNEANGCVDTIQDSPGNWAFPLLKDLSFQRGHDCPPGHCTSDIYVQVVERDGSYVLVVQWQEVSPYGDPTSHFTFQVQLEIDGTVKFLYKQSQSQKKEGWNEFASVGLTSFGPNGISHQQLSCDTNGLQDQTLIQLNPGPMACDFWFADCDGDTSYRAAGIESCAEPPTVCNDGQVPDGGWSIIDPGVSADCDDEDGTEFPGQLWYADCDGDAFETFNPIMACDSPLTPCLDFASPDGGYSHNPGTDCDDEDGTEFPGQTWYADCDGDTYEDNTSVIACDSPFTPCLDFAEPDGGWSNSVGNDCDDEDGTEFPGQVWFADCDADGDSRSSSVSACDLAGAIALTPCGDGLAPDGGWTHAAGADCDDEDGNEFPGQSWYADCDGDTAERSSAITACDLSAADAATPCTDNQVPDGGWSLIQGSDCDDEDGSEFPGQFWYSDCDGDTFMGTSAIVACDNPVSFCADLQAPDGGWSNSVGSDCDDEDGTQFPGQTWYADCDNDSYERSAAVIACDNPVSPCVDNNAPDGGYTHVAGSDCDDEDGNEFPGQSWYADCDGDTAERSSATTACDLSAADAATPCTDNQVPDGGWSSVQGDDCDDEDASEFPGQSWYADCDGDTFERANQVTACDNPVTPCVDGEAPDGGWSNSVGSDCDDEDGTQFPGQTWYADCDNDSFERTASVIACDSPVTPCIDGQAPDGGYTHVAGSDCDDEDGNEFPGQSWYADCDGDTVERSSAITACDLSAANAATPCTDNQVPDGGWSSVQGDDCDDEDPALTSTATWYADCDGDGAERSPGVESCGTPASVCNDGEAPDGGWTTTDPGGAADCDDEDASEFPGQSWYADCDGDTFERANQVTACDNPVTPCVDGEAPDGGYNHVAGSDCDDEDATEFPGQSWYADCDNDSFERSAAVIACDNPVSPCVDNNAPDGGYTHVAGSDCDDEDGNEFPGQNWYADCDGDTFERGSATTACDLSAANASTPCSDDQSPDGGWSLVDPGPGADCDDENAGLFSTDTWYADCDGDGTYRSPGVVSCGTPATVCTDFQAPDGGWSNMDPGVNADCDDEDPTEFPGQSWYADCDGDGQERNAAVVACDTPGSPCNDALTPDGGWAFVAGPDCDDEDGQNYFGNTEICDGQDNDCNGLDDAFNPGVGGWETDGDLDGVSECQGDCNDDDENYWLVPNEVTGLGWNGASLEWSAPSAPGTISPSYDVIQSTDPADLAGASSSCDGFDLLFTTHLPAADPPPGVLFVYVVVAKSGCGAGSGGTDSDAVDRVVRFCT